MTEPIKSMDEIPANNGNFTSISTILIHDRAYKIHAFGKPGKTKLKKFPLGKY